MKILSSKARFITKFLGVAFVLIIGLFAIFASNWPNKEAKLIKTGYMFDQDGNKYQTVKIGDQWWMSENLKVTHYRNGEIIRHVNNQFEWINLIGGAYCAYDMDASNVDTYGYLYNFKAVNDENNIAPEGWHVPSDAEWKELEIYLGMSQSEADAGGYRGTDEGNKLKSASGWSSDGNGTNESGFSALPAGSRDGSGVFGGMGGRACFWTGTPFLGSGGGYQKGGWCRELHSSQSNIYRANPYDRLGYSVRLIRDADN